MPWITFHGTFQRFIAQDGKYVFQKPIIQFVIVLDEVTKQQHPFICKNTVGETGGHWDIFHIVLNSWTLRNNMHA